MRTMTRLLLRTVRLAGGPGEAFRRARQIARAEGLPGLRRRLRRTIRREASYDTWIDRFDDRPEIGSEVYSTLLSQQAVRPLFSIVIPARGGCAQGLKATIDSVRDQIYVNWQLCLCRFGPDDADMEEFLEGQSTSDSRIRLSLTNGTSFAAASNTALATATGDWIVSIRCGDVLRAHALAELALAIRSNPRGRLIYSDHDSIDEMGARSEPQFKPDWSPDLLRSYNYIGHVSAMAARNLQALHGWREDLDTAGDFDLALRFTERLGRDEVIHIPKVLYHCRHSPSVWDASAGAYLEEAQKSIQDHLARTGRSGTVVVIDTTPLFRVRYALPASPPLTSIIIPNKDKFELIRTCVESVARSAADMPYELLLVDNCTTDARTLAYYDELQRQGAKILSYPMPFNYSAMNNAGISEAGGEILLFLNNDTAAMTDGWLAELVAQANRPEIGCVGAKLYYEDRTVQHAGIFVGVGGVASHPDRGLAQGDRGYGNRLQVVHNLSAVTAACMAVRRSVALEVDGFDEEAFKVALNDVDFCLKVREAGYNNLWTPFAELYHFESKSRGYEVGQEKKMRLENEILTFSARWQSYIAEDPYFSPNLDRMSEFVSIRQD